LQRSCEIKSVQSSRASKGQQNEIARIEATFNRYASQGAFHVVVYDRDYTFSSNLNGDLSASGPTHIVSKPAHCQSCPLNIKIKVSTQKFRLRKVAQHEMRISYSCQI
jgi:hypothetical protein